MSIRSPELKVLRDITNKLHSEDHPKAPTALSGPERDLNDKSATSSKDIFCLDRKRPGGPQYIWGLSP